ncbi:hypothetical protein BRC19_01530 [Candidatus Saccharibacteria bacterium QS_5_54_17]|nr:MAG: hypothetical protein BRC19_01530 [Candidatus Saccharibacteria bacterium QS_5_54_17]
MLGVAIGLSTPEQAWARSDQSSDSVKGKWMDNARIRIEKNGNIYAYGSNNESDADDQLYLLKSEGSKVEHPWDIVDDPLNPFDEGNCVDYIHGDSFGPKYPHFNKDTTTKSATLTIRDHIDGEDGCYKEEKNLSLNDPEKANIEFRQIDDKTIEPVHNKAFTKPGNVDFLGLEPYQFGGTYKIDSGYSEHNDGERYVNTEGSEGCTSELIKRKKGDSTVDATFKHGSGEASCSRKEFKDLQLAPQDSGRGGDDQDDSSAGHPGQPVDSGGDDDSGDDGGGSDEQSGQSGDGDGSGVGRGDSSGVIGNCTEQSSFLTFPTWYRGLQCEEGGSGAPVFSKMSDIWTVATNLLDILIQLGALAAVGFIIYGGIRYILSQGEPEKLQGAKKIIANAIIGLILAITASTIVGFIAGSFS